ncbi:MAG: SDR family oxidoreductase [Rhizomicrobium sp.]|jgi:NAD(P)-dependent dehydrogenase (short-subunit alcohol dehydrogenase family)
MTAKTALVTGAGTGIGRATSLALIEAGFTVVLAGRRVDLLEATAALAGDRSRSSVIRTDVSDEQSVDRLFGHVEQSFGRLDVLFNNAGTGTLPKPFDELTLAEWNRTVAVNLTGAFLCARRAFRLMRAQQPRGGRIINNGSISAHAPRPMSAPYTATKHAMTGLTRALSLDGRPYDIACGQIDIGNAATDMTARIAEGALQPDGAVRPEPTMDVSEVARAVVYMASLPLSTNVQFMTVMATKMPFVGRG